MSQPEEHSLPAGGSVENVPQARATRSGRLNLGGAVFLLFPLLAFLLLGDVLFGGRVLLPAEYLKGFLPWSQAFPASPAPNGPQWNVLQWDGMAEFFPWRLFAAREFAQGRIPLWDPYVLCGTPFLANSQSAPLYPLHLLLYLPPDAGAPLATATRMAWLAFLHLSLAGSFAYLFARQMELRPLAAALAGAAFELSGFAVAWLELPSFIAVSCWIPLAMLCLVRTVRESSVRWAVGGAVATGMMLLAGHLQIAFYGLLALGLLWLWEVGGLRGSGGSCNLIRTAGLGLLVVGLGFALAAPQFLSSIELSRISHRVGPPTETGYAEYVKLALPLQNWITLLVPDYYGLPARGDYWAYWGYGPPNVMEYAGHVGSAACLLVLLGIAFGRRIHQRTGFFLGLAVFVLLLAVGSPLGRLFYFAVPGFAQSGSPARSLVLFCLCQAMLAGLGLEWLLRAVEARWQSVLVPVVAAAATVGALAFGFHLLAAGAFVRLGLDAGQVAQLVGAVSMPALLRSIGFLAGTGFLLCLMAWLMRENKPHHRTAVVGGSAVAAVAGVQILLGGAYNPSADPALAFPATPWTDALRASGARVATLNEEWRIDAVPKALLPPNASIAYGYRDAQGYDSLWLGTYRRLADAINERKQGASPPLNGNIVFMKDPASPLFPLVGARYVVSKTPLAIPGLVIPPGAPSGPPYIYEDRRALPEAYLVSEWQVAEDGEALAALRQRANELDRLAFIAPGRGATPQTAGKGAPNHLQAATVERLGPGHLRAQVEAPVHSLLVLSEGFAPGWKATVQPAGGAAVRTPIRRTNVAFQGIVLPAGSYTVTWRYMPDSFRTGLFLAMLALTAVAAVTVARPGARRLPR